MVVSAVGESSLQTGQQEPVSSGGASTAEDKTGEKETPTAEKTVSNSNEAKPADPAPAGKKKARKGLLKRVLKPF